jgi:molybdate transport system regulatory protein
MNKLTGKITRIQQSGAILLVDAEAGGHSFSAMLIDSASQQHWLQEGNRIYIVFKETEVSLAKNLSGMISIRNRMKCIVQSIERGELLSKIILQFQEYTIISAITTRSVDMLQLQMDDEVEALVKANEVSFIKY